MRAWKDNITVDLKRRGYGGADGGNLGLFPMKGFIISYVSLELLFL
jgi:hypothetical protein